MNYSVYYLPMAEVQHLHRSKILRKLNKHLEKLLLATLSWRSSIFIDSVFHITIRLYHSLSIRKIINSYIFRLLQTSLSIFWKMLTQIFSFLISIHSILLCTLASGYNCWFDFTLKFRVSDSIVSLFSYFLSLFC